MFFNKSFTKGFAVSSAQGKPNSVNNCNLSFAKAAQVLLSYNFFRKQTFTGVEFVCWLGDVNKSSKTYSRLHLTHLAFMGLSNRNSLTQCSTSLEEWCHYCISRWTRPWAAASYFMSVYLPSCSLTSPYVKCICSLWASFVYSVELSCLELESH